MIKAFFFIKPIIIDTRKLDLLNKSPLFAYISTTINGILQIRVYNE